MLCKPAAPYELWSWIYTVQKVDVDCIAQFHCLMKHSIEALTEKEMHELKRQDYEEYCLLQTLGEFFFLFCLFCWFIYCICLFI